MSRAKTDFATQAERDAWQTGFDIVAQLHAQTPPPGTKVCDLIDAQPRELHEAVLGGFMSALHGER